ncbi:uncharacterized protein LOC126355201, partial [Schistocerca gregaria]|uniref:uncharacterized protein LOC126355201 n=1 Tax=Schistocerca gregaria TaxID=7010 RepID=UPI00211ED1D3
MFSLLFLLCLTPLRCSVARTVTARQWTTVERRLSSDSDVLRSVRLPGDEVASVEHVRSSVNVSGDSRWSAVPRLLIQAGRAIVRDVLYSANVSNSTGRSVASETLMDCVLGLSLPCFGRKFIFFVDLIDRKDRIRLLGDSVVLVKRAQSRSQRGDTDEDNEVATKDGESALEDLVVERLEDFAESRALRIRMPAWTSVTVSPGGEEGTSKELDFVLDTEIDEEEEGRKKKKKLKKKLLKILKKVAIGLAVVLAAKLPLALLAIKFIAIKAKILSITALALLLVQKLMMSGGGDDCSSSCDSGGGGDSGGY